MKKDTQNNYLAGLFCPECGKNFFPPVPSEWAWRVGARIFCSYHCRRKAEIAQAERKKPGRAVEMLDPDGTVVREFSDATVAGAFLNLSPGSIRNCCAGKSKTCNGKRWRYKPSQAPQTSDKADGMEVGA